MFFGITPGVLSLILEALKAKIRDKFCDRGRENYKPSEFITCFDFPYLVISNNSAFSFQPRVPPVPSSKAAGLWELHSANVCVGSFLTSKRTVETQSSDHSKPHLKSS